MTVARHWLQIKSYFVCYTVATGWQCSVSVSVSGAVPVNLFVSLFRYLALVESLPTYGVHYYPVKVKVVPESYRSLISKQAPINLLSSFFFFFFCI